MCLLAMPFEGFSIKECNGAEGTLQLHAQMGMAHMRTDCIAGGQGPLRASLTLGVVDLVGISYLEM